MHGYLFSREKTCWINILGSKIRMFWLFFPNVTGLLVTYVALNLMDGHGQPALLYIVPFTLGTFHGRYYFVNRWKRIETIMYLEKCSNIWLGAYFCMHWLMQEPWWHWGGSEEIWGVCGQMENFKNPVHI